jgi:hypothetical protein
VSKNCPYRDRIGLQFDHQIRFWSGLFGGGAAESYDRGFGGCDGVCPLCQCALSYCQCALSTLPVSTANLRVSTVSLGEVNVDKESGHC